jgi:hypothetical protein
MKQWLNDISRDINENLYKKRSQRPSTSLRYKWHEEFLALGVDKRMTFLAYAKLKTQEWRKTKRN